MSAFIDQGRERFGVEPICRTLDVSALAIVQWVAWFNNDRLHESLGDIPPTEFEAAHLRAQTPRAQAASSAGEGTTPTTGLYAARYVSSTPTPTYSKEETN